MGQIDITDFVTNLINSITDEKIINKADKTYVDDNFVLNTLFEEQINLKSNIDHNHDDRYYTESEMDIKLSEIESSIVGASGFSVSKVDVLPESGEFNTIYLVPSESPTENNKYNNYIWTGTEYDEIGGASPADIDLSDYATLEYLTSELSKYTTIATLNTELSKKANNDHTHDARYYTESEVDDLFTQLNDILETKSDVGHTHIIDDVSNLQSTLDNKAPSSHVHSGLVPTSIPANSDLNDYTTQGSFYCAPNTVSQTVTNTPYEQSFHLEVYKTVDGGVCQVAYSFHQDNVHTWKRNGYYGKWSQWYEIIDTNKVDSSLSSTSTNPVQNKVVNTALNGKANSSHSHSVVTTSVDGFMSNDDKVKLNGIATGANKTVVDTALSSSSTNPVQNKVVKAQLDSLNNNKANKNHTHNSLSPVILGTNVDFNNYKTEGTYVISWDNVQSATNAPNKTGGRLEVISIQNGVKQIYHNYGISESRLKIWWRNYYPTSNTWFDWQQIIDGKAYSSTTLKDNTFCQVFGNVAIVSWWSGAVNTPYADEWVDLWTLPVTNKGKTVWTGNLHNSERGALYFKVEAGSNKVQALSSFVTGNLPHYPGQLVFFID